ncbi:MAG: hypothetical protein FWC40_09225, partial [Proteobacteria bacterium]|nr:hypothetical protein [Pseudomonadota bacterium]
FDALRTRNARPCDTDNYIHFSLFFGFHLCRSGRAPPARKAYRRIDPTCQILFFVVAHCLSVKRLSVTKNRQIGLPNAATPLIPRFVYP